MRDTSSARTASGSVVLPDTADLMTWDVGDHGFAMGLSPKVPDAIAKHLAADAGAPVQGPFHLLEDQDASALGQHETVPVRVERP